jgi:hypothetical protein
MLILILFLLAGSVLVYLSQHNLMLVALNVGPYVLADIPLFYVIIGSFIAGLVLSYVSYLVHALTTTLLLRHKEQEIKKGRAEILELTRRVHQLELANEKLQQSTHPELTDPNAL